MAINFMCVCSSSFLACTNSRHSEHVELNIILIGMFLLLLFFAGLGSGGCCIVLFVLSLWVHGQDRVKNNISDLDRQGSGGQWQCLSEESRGGAS